MRKSGFTKGALGGGHCVHGGLRKKWRTGKPQERLKACPETRSSLPANVLIQQIFPRFFPKAGIKKQHPPKYSPADGPIRRPPEASCPLRTGKSHITSPCASEPDRQGLRTHYPDHACPLTPLETVDPENAADRTQRRPSGNSRRQPSTALPGANEKHSACDEKVYPAFSRKRAFLPKKERRRCVGQGVKAPLAEKSYAFRQGAARRFSNPGHRQEGSGQTPKDGP